MRANFYLQGKTLKGKKTYSTASPARADKGNYPSALSNDGPQALWNDV